MMRLMQLKPYLDQIVQAARENGDYERAGLWLISNVEPSLISQYVLDEEMFAKVCGYIPNGAPLKPWLDKFRFTILNALNPEIEEPGEHSIEIPEAESNVLRGDGEETTDIPNEGTLTREPENPDNTDPFRDS